LRKDNNCEKRFAQKARCVAGIEWARDERDFPHQIEAELRGMPKTSCIHKQRHGKKGAHTDTLLSKKKKKKWVRAGSLCKG